MKPLPVSSATVLASVASGCRSRDSADQVRTSLQYNNDHRLLCSGCSPSLQRAELTLACTKQS